MKKSFIEHFSKTKKNNQIQEEQNKNQQVIEKNNIKKEFSLEERKRLAYIEFKQKKKERKIDKTRENEKLSIEYDKRKFGMSIVNYILNHDKILKEEEKKKKFDSYLKKKEEKKEKKMKDFFSYKNWSFSDNKSLERKLFFKINILSISKGFIYLKQNKLYKKLLFLKQKLKKNYKKIKFKNKIIFSIHKLILNIKKKIFYKKYFIIKRNFLNFYKLFGIKKTKLFIRKKYYNNIYSFLKTLNLSNIILLKNKINLLENNYIIQNYNLFYLKELLNFLSLDLLKNNIINRKYINIYLLYLHNKYNKYIKLKYRKLINYYKVRKLISFYSLNIPNNNLFRYTFLSKISNDKFSIYWNNFFINKKFINKKLFKIKKISNKKLLYYLQKQKKLRKFFFRTFRKKVFNLKFIVLKRKNLKKKLYFNYEYGTNINKELFNRKKKKIFKNEILFNEKKYLFNFFKKKYLHFSNLQINILVDQFLKKKLNNRKKYNRLISIANFKLVNSFSRYNKRYLSLNRGLNFIFFKKSEIPFFLNLKKKKNKILRIRKKSKYSLKYLNFNKTKKYIVKKGIYSTIYGYKKFKSKKFHLLEPYYNIIFKKSEYPIKFKKFISFYSYNYPITKTIQFQYLKTIYKINYRNYRKNLFIILNKFFLSKNKFKIIKIGDKYKKLFRKININKKNKIFFKNYLKNKNKFNLSSIDLFSNQDKLNNIKKIDNSFFRIRNSLLRLGINELSDFENEYNKQLQEEYYQINNINEEKKENKINIINIKEKNVESNDIKNNFKYLLSNIHLLNKIKKKITINKKKYINNKNYSYNVKKSNSLFNNNFNSNYNFIKLFLKKIKEKKIKNKKSSSNYFGKKNLFKNKFNHKNKFNNKDKLFHAEQQNNKQLINKKYIINNKKKIFKIKKRKRMYNKFEKRRFFMQKLRNKKIKLLFLTSNLINNNYIEQINYYLNMKKKKEFEIDYIINKFRKFNILINKIIYYPIRLKAELPIYKQSDYLYAYWNINFLYYKFIGYLIIKGKKKKAEILFNNSLFFIREFILNNPIFFFFQAVYNSQPLFEYIKHKKRYKTIVIPKITPFHKRLNLAMRNLAKNIRNNELLRKFKKTNSKYRINSSYLLYNTFVSSFLIKGKIRKELKENSKEAFSKKYLFRRGTNLNKKKNYKYNRLLKFMSFKKIRGYHF